MLFVTYLVISSLVFIILKIYEFPTIHNKMDFVVLLFLSFIPLFNIISLVASIYDYRVLIKYDILKFWKGWFYV